MASAAVAIPTLGSTLAGIRVAGRLRQEDLAPMLDSNVDKISSVENDKSPCTVQFFIRWCNACGADPQAVIASVPV